VATTTTEEKPLLRRRPKLIGMARLASDGLRTSTKNRKSIDGRGEEVRGKVWMRWIEKSVRARGI
jgi:hypothetical protein